MGKNFTPSFTIILFFLSLALISSHSYGNADFKYQKIKEFIPQGYQLLDTASGDFNADGVRDYIIVLKSNNENVNLSGERPLLLLAGTSKGRFELVARNDSVVLGADCGGIFGDPYQKISIDGQFFSVEHSVGGNWKWSRAITFKYNTETKEIVLHEDVTRSYQSFSRNKQKSIASNKEDFGNLPFSSYSYNKNFRD